MRAPRSAARVVDGDRALVDGMSRTVGNAHSGKVRFTWRRLGALDATGDDRP
jgi:hypothetical protein